MSCPVPAPDRCGKRCRPILRTGPPGEWTHPGRPSPPEVGGANLPRGMPSSSCLPTGDPSPGVGPRPGTHPLVFMDARREVDRERPPWRPFVRVPIRVALEAGRHGPLTTRSPLMRAAGTGNDHLASLLRRHTQVVRAGRLPPPRPSPGGIWRFPPCHSISVCSATAYILSGCGGSSRGATRRVTSNAWLESCGADPGVAGADELELRAGAPSSEVFPVPSEGR